MPKVAFLSGAPRVSTKDGAQAGGARQHVLGTIAGFKDCGWSVVTYIVGDKVPASWLKGDSERELSRSLLRRIAADAVRIILSAYHTRLALNEIKATDWVYERCGAFQLFGFFFKRRSTPWILETNYIMFEELLHDRKSVALGFLLRWIEVFAYRKCDVLVVISGELKDAIVDKAGIQPSKIVVVPNAADTALFDPAVVATRRLFGAETFIIGFQGSMYKWAGLDYLIKAVHVLRNRGFNVAAVLVGDGHERALLEDLSVELGIADHIAFVGFVPRSHVPEYIAGFDLCYSGQIKLQNNKMYLSPLKLYDYMSMGKPILASRFADAVSLLKNGCPGYLFASASLEDLVSAATRAFHDRHGFAGAAASTRAMIICNHSWASRLRDFIVEAQSVLDGQNSARATRAEPRPGGLAPRPGLSESPTSSRK